jgi:hypothetical protein
MARSPRRRIPVASVIGELTVLRTRLGFAKTSADLTPATGARTTRFCRTQQRRSSCADRLLTVSSTKPETALQRLARAGAIASIAPRTPRIVTTRTPLFDEAGWREDGVDLGEMRSGIFLQRNLDDPNHVESADEIRAFAQRVLRRFWTSAVGWAAPSGGQSEACPPLTLRTLMEWRARRLAPLPTLRSPAPLLSA